MPQQRMDIRMIKDILRLKYSATLSHEAIARSLGISKGVVAKYVKLAEAAGLTATELLTASEEELERRLRPSRPIPVRHVQPDYAVVHQELKRKGVTLQLLWEEHHAAHGARAHRYSQFCAHYRFFRDRLARSMRQVHRAGEKLFIDYSGDTVAVIDAGSGEILTAQIFVAVMGASKYAYAEATWTQSLPDWIASHIRAFEFLQACPALAPAATQIPPPVAGVNSST